MRRRGKALKGVFVWRGINTLLHFLPRRVLRLLLVVCKAHAGSLVVRLGGNRLRWSQLDLELTFAVTGAGSGLLQWPHVSAFYGSLL